MLDFTKRLLSWALTPVKLGFIAANCLMTLMFLALDAGEELLDKAHSALVKCSSWVRDGLGLVNEAVCALEGTFDTMLEKLEGSYVEEPSFVGASWEEPVLETKKAKKSKRNR